MHIWGPLRSSMTKVTLLNGTDRCLSDWLNLFDWATGRLRLHKSFKGRRFCKCEKKEGGERKGKRNTPATFPQRQASICTHSNGFQGALFISLKLLLRHCAGTFRSPAANNGRQLGKSVNCRRHWSGAELSRWLESAGASCWAALALEMTQLIQFPLRIQSTPV